MMKKIKILGKEYPARLTMGAMRRFKLMTGKDVSEMGEEIDLLGAFIYCCVKSACNADKVEFDLDIETFTDAVDISQMNEFMAVLNPEDKKKETPTE